MLALLLTMACAPEPETPEEACIAATQALCDCGERTSCEDGQVEASCDGTDPDPEDKGEGAIAYWGCIEAGACDGSWEACDYQDY